MTDRELFELNEALKTRPLTREEWERLDTYMKEKDESYIIKLAAEYPLIALKYKHGNFEYKIFLSICAGLLNQKENFIRKGYTAKVADAKLGDGAECVLVIKGTIGSVPVSAIEEYSEFIKANGNGVIDHFIDNLINVLP